MIDIIGLDYNVFKFPNNEIGIKLKELKKRKTSN